MTRKAEQPGRIESLARNFRRLHGRPPSCGASAPGRVNLIGEHTDYNEGFVLPFAIDARATVLATADVDAAVSTLTAADLDESIEIDLRGELTPRPGHWSNYVTGVVDQLRRRGLEVPNLRVVIGSEVPIGMGLSSSAALETATATLLEEITATRLDPMENVLLCQQAEHAFPGTPCGIMDMYAAVFGRAGHALLIDCRSRRHECVPLPPPDRLALLVVDSGVRHDLAAGEYAERRRACERVAAHLGLRSLRDAAVGMLDRPGIAETDRRRARHVLEENERTLAAADALRRGAYERLGDLLHASHASLRDLFDVSCPELDTIVDTAVQLRDRGVYGARLTGGGFGGCAIVLCRADAVELVRAHLQEAMPRRSGGGPEVRRVAAGDGARAERVDQL